MIFQIGKNSLKFYSCYFTIKHLKFLVYSILFTVYLSGCGLEPAEYVAHSNPILPWPNATIPYILDSDFSDFEANNIKDAMEEWSSRTGVVFKERENEFNYLYVDKVARKCEAYVGFGFFGKHTMRVYPGCGFDGYLHELGHILGLIHEQQRADRDQYIEILWENIEDEIESNFYKISKIEAPITTPYDYKSIMHYDLYAFSVNGQKTMRILQKDVVDSDDPLYNTEVTELDVEKIKNLYNLK